MNIALILSYDGTAYHGWQIQKNAVSVQETVTRAVQSVLGQTVSVSGVGRTDAGVHARRYVANFHADCAIPMDRLPLALTARLPMDIAVSGAAVVPDDFDARFQCTRKEYTYLICPGRIRDPFEVHRSYFYPYPLDVEAMNRGAQYFVGRKDFAAVRSVGTPVKSPTVPSTPSDRLCASASVQTDFYTTWCAPFPERCCTSGRAKSLPPPSLTFLPAATASRPDRHCRRTACL